MRHFYLKKFNFTCTTFFSIILYETITNVDMRTSCENLNSMHTRSAALPHNLAVRRHGNPAHPCSHPLNVLHQADNRLEDRSKEQSKE